MLLLAPSAAATPPNVRVTIGGTLGSNSWYRSNVTINWQVEGETSSTGCDTVTLAVDTPGTKVTCSAENNGDTTTQSVTIKLDKTAPTVTTTVERQPDANGWYNRPLTVAFTGTDTTSGIGSCSSARYVGPDNAAAAIAGSCSDNAGNVAAGSFPFRYDATAPSLSSVTTKLRNRGLDLAWKASSDTQRIEVARAPGIKGAPVSVVYQGAAASFRDTDLKPGRRYRYRVSGLDAAANRVDHTLVVTATGALLSPAPGQRVTKPPVFIWTQVKRASYYNLQLIRGRKVISAWPVRPTFHLPRTWIYRGRRHRLRPGVYRWYVWPGYGRIRANRYGRLLGSSSFVVPR